MRDQKRNRLAAFELDGKTIELYSIQIRMDGSNQTGSGFLLHDAADEANDRDKISGGIAGVDAPETAEEFDNFVKLSNWTSNFRIDGNGYYIFTE
jgi:hypothetical protein